VTGGKPIAILLQSISGVSAVNALVAIYDIHGGKREVLFFYFGPDTTRDYYYLVSVNTYYMPITYKILFIQKNIQQKEILKNNRIQQGILLLPKYDQYFKAYKWSTKDSTYRAPPGGCRR
jgi:hypothetical protein